VLCVVSLTQCVEIGTVVLSHTWCYDQDVPRPSVFVGHASEQPGMPSAQQPGRTLATIWSITGTISGCRVGELCGTITSRANQQSIKLNNQVDQVELVSWREVKDMLLLLKAIYKDSLHCRGYSRELRRAFERSRYGMATCSPSICLKLHLMSLRCSSNKWISSSVSPALLCAVTGPKQQEQPTLSSSMACMMLRSWSSGCSSTEASWEHCNYTDQDL